MPTRDLTSTQCSFSSADAARLEEEFRSERELTEALIREMNQAIDCVAVRAALEGLVLHCIDATQKHAGQLNRPTNW